MNATATTSRFTGSSPNLTARAGGFFWLMTILAGTLAMLSSGKVVAVAGMAAAACYIAATVFVYLLLKPVHRAVSLLAACCSVAGCAVGALGGQLAQNGVHFLFFGLHCLLVGALILRSTFLPRAVGALMAVGGLGWLAFALLRVLESPLTASLSPYLMGLGILGEVTLTLSLLVLGVNVPRWREQARAAA